MNPRFLFLSIFFIVSSISFGQKINETKKNIIASVENHKNEILKISDQIWELAELAFDEHKSSKLLSDYAEKNGFTVDWDWAW